MSAGTEGIAHQLLQLFFQAPLSNALLVYEENDYQGLVFKKDVQLGIQEEGFDLAMNINYIEKQDAADLILKTDTEREQIKIPAIDRQGQLLAFLSYQEFICQFSFHHFLDGFHMDRVWDALDHPLIITDYFKKVLYLNKEALLISRKDLLGQKINPFLRQFSMEIKEEKMVLLHIDKIWELVISQAKTRDFHYWIYQFFPLG